MKFLPPILLSLLAAAAAAQTPPASSAARSAPPTSATCPAGLPAQTRCLTGQDSAGAFYWMAVPARWDRVLVLHAHGGPELGDPKPERSAADLTRWAITVRAGHAWAGSTFRQGGVEVRAAAEDTERLRQIFVQHVAQPRRTLLHGQSWGASVAAKGAEMFATALDGRPPYDGVLLTSGVLGGGTQSYDFRLDLRVVYQALCNNHPLPHETAYPLWQGLPPDSALTRAELARRVDECTGLRFKPEQRSATQQRTLTSLLTVLRIPERSLIGHLNWGTWHFADVVSKRLDGGNPFGNIGARYVGSDDDEALNAKVARYRADPQAVARFSTDTDPNGRIAVPVLAAHAIDDPVAFVELEDVFRQTMQQAGFEANLVQVFTGEAEHSYWSDPEYPALLEALLAWVERDEKPSATRVAQACERMKASFPGGCHFVESYIPPPLSRRVTPRER